MPSRTTTTASSANGSGPSPARRAARPDDGLDESRDHAPVIGRQPVEPARSTSTHGDARRRGTPRRTPAGPGVSGRRGRRGPPSARARRGPPRRPRVCPPTTVRPLIASTSRARGSPTPSPASPRPSGRVAFTETRSAGMPSAAASAARISARRGRDRRPVADHRDVAGRRDAGRRSATSATVRARSSRPADPRDAGSVSGKCSPTSPSAAAPSNASATRVADGVAVGVAGEAGPRPSNRTPPSHSGRGRGRAGARRSRGRRGIASTPQPSTPGLGPREVEQRW